MKKIIVISTAIAILLLISLAAYICSCIEPLADIVKSDIFEEQPGTKFHCSSVTELDDGSLFAIWYSGRTRHGEGDPDCALQGSVYRNGAWSPVFTAYDTPGKADNNSVIFYNPVKRCLYLFAGVMQSAKNDYSKMHTFWLSADISKAEDIVPSAIQWRFRGALSERGWTQDLSETAQGFVLRNKPLIDGDRMLLPIYSHGAKSIAAVIPMSLKDEVWGDMSSVSGSDKVEQPSLVSIKGRIVMLCRNTDRDAMHAFQSVSDDHGMTWSSLTSVPGLTNQNNSIDSLALPDGSLLLCRNNNWTRNKLWLSLSADGCLAFKSIALESSSFAEFSYPCMILSRDKKTIHIVYTRERKTITHAVIPVDRIRSLFGLKE